MGILGSATGRIAPPCAVERIEHEGRNFHRTRPPGKRNAHRPDSGGRGHGVRPGSSRSRPPPPIRRRRLDAVRRRKGVRVHLRRRLEREGNPVRERLGSGEAARWDHGLARPVRALWPRERDDAGAQDQRPRIRLMPGYGEDRTRPPRHAGRPTGAGPVTGAEAASSPMKKGRRGHGALCTSGPRESYRPLRRLFSRSAARSVFSQANSLRPKWPYAAVFW